MKKHLLYYISLFAIVVAGVILATSIPLGRTTQIAAIVGMSVLYCFLGILHHILHHSFSLKIMLEYIAIATLGICITLFFFNVAL